MMSDLNYRSKMYLKYNIGYIFNKLNRTKRCKLKKTTLLYNDFLSHLTWYLVFLRKHDSDLISTNVINLFNIS